MNKKQRSEYMKSLGKKGGNATKKKYGLSHFQALGSKGQKALIKNLSEKI